MEIHLVGLDDPASRIFQAHTMPASTADDTYMPGGVLVRGDSPRFLDRELRPYQ